MVLRTESGFKSAIKLISFSTTKLVAGSLIFDDNPGGLLILGYFLLSLCLLQLVTPHNIGHKLFKYLSSAFFFLSLLVIYMWRIRLLSLIEIYLIPDIYYLLCLYATLPFHLPFCLTLGVILSVTWITKLDINLSYHNQSTMMQHQQSDMANNTNVLCGYFMLWTIINIIGVYLNLSNSNRYRRAFVDWGNFIVAQSNIHTERKRRARCMKYIIPETLLPGYLRFMQQHQQHQHQQRQQQQQQQQRPSSSSTAQFPLPIFCETFSNVSVVLAKLLGFGKLMNNSSSVDCVMPMIDTLVNRFDAICVDMACTKIITYNDCYCCISGLETEDRLDYDHVVNAVYMGLAMHRCMVAFNKEFKTNIDISVGIHSGKVLGAVIGSERLQFNVFSNAIATVVQMITLNYRQSPNMLVTDAIHCRSKKVFKYRLEGTIKVKEFLKTMEVTLYSVILTQKTQRRLKNRLITYNKVAEKKPPQHLLKCQTDSDDDDTNTTALLNERTYSDSDSDQSDALHILETTNQYQSDRAFINALVTDPKLQIKQLNVPPLHYYRLNYSSKMKEKEYRTFRNMTKRTYDSHHLSALHVVPACNAVISVVVLSLYYMTIHYFFRHNKSIDQSSVFLCLIPTAFGVGLCAFSLLFGEIRQTDRRNISVQHTMRTFFHSWYGQNFLALTVSCSCYLNSVILLKPSSLYRDYRYSVCMENLVIFAMLPPCFYYCVSSRLLLLVNILYGSAWALGNVVHILRSIPTSTVHNYGIMSNYYEHHSEYTSIPYAFLFTIDIVLTLCCVHVISMRNEIAQRVAYYSKTESDRLSEELQQMKKQNEGILQSILPSYVLSKVLRRRQRHMNLSYAVEVRQAGVAVICISNFLKKFYYEDNEQGEKSVQMLNAIISLFDDVLIMYKKVTIEKIKFITDHYVVASGLNVDAVSAAGAVVRNGKNKDHLTAMIDFLFQIQTVLKHFNEAHLHYKNPFTLKIGFNIGTIVTGVIGREKPVYDIWGNAVSLTSKLCTMGVDGKIQVTREVTKTLRKHCEFEYRGPIFIDKKNVIHTFFAIDYNLEKQKKDTFMFYPDSDC